ncbi:palmitoyl-protein thioesterase 1 isoform X2 [Eurytemora carolleeae]|uniref:palmitoyl-protein thioesterase 1 isoform X2 n=1 Tax=Eurytemora carolleeae TaxID=1294199 RepID=UPI000C7823FE|nr:palmitoyl-protein thioesterase 1 isoform X2 [Eurytemora carolleeae]|eukprot:XP_023341576.1 palmitoyl-protein thioesterase 1-like isoform X2 [Eurytemora affinis]
MRLLGVCLLVQVLTGSIILQDPEQQRQDRTPIVLWHGMGDSCCNPFSMGSVINLLQEKIPGVYVLSLMIGSNVIQDTENGFFMNINDQISEACSTIRNDSRLTGGFHAVGFSQGGLFLRGLVQRCGDLKVRNLVSIGGPQQGVYGLPHCLGEDHTICDYIRRLLNYGAYTSWIQRLLVQAQYWHDPRAEEEFSEKSLFLADINNQGEKMNPEYPLNLDIVL